MTERSTLLAVAVASLVVGAALGLAVPSMIAPSDATSTHSPPPQTTSSPSSQPFSMSFANPHCLNNGSHDGWLYAAADGDHYNYAFNVTIRDARGQTIAHDVTHLGGDYTVHLDTAPAKQTKPGGPNCPVGTTVVGAGALPTDYNSVRIVVGNRTVATMQNTGDTTPRLHSIQGAVGSNASTSAA